MSVLVSVRNDSMFISTNIVLLSLDLVTLRIFLLGHFKHGIGTLNQGDGANFDNRRFRNLVTNDHAPAYLYNGRVSMYLA